MRSLAKTYLNADIQSGDHSSIIDARVTMALFLTKKSFFETKVKVLNPSSWPILNTEEGGESYDKSKYVFKGVSKANSKK